MQVGDLVRFKRDISGLEKAMGIVEDDRPKEKTAYGIKTYKDKK